MSGSENIFPDIGRRYKIIEQIGRGGMADVFRVLDRETGEDVACKVLHERFQEAHASQRFAAEFRLTSRLKHPNIITVYDYGLTPDRRPFYTMALVEGTTLEQASRRMSLPELFSAIFDVCLALDRIHQAGLIHNDVKDRNVMLTASGRAILMDLGLANTGLTQTKHFKGTIGYAAPELLRGEAYSHRADLYSLGVMIYHCLAQRLPFPGDTIAAVIQSQITGRIIPLADVKPGINPQISRIVSRLLAVDPLRRYPSAPDVLGALEAVPETRLASRSAELAPVYGLPEDFAGRQTLLMRLKTFSSGAEPDRSPMILLTGPQGIGKSRLARELKIHLQTEGYRFIGVSVPASRRGPLAAIHTALHAALTEAGPDADDIVREQAPYLNILFPGRFPETLPASYRLLEPARRRALFLEQLAAAFVRLVSDRPTVLFLDDLHLANESLLRWLAGVTKTAANNQSLRLLAAADEPQWHDTQAMRDHIRLPAETLAVEPFTENETKIFLEKRFGSIPVSRRIVRRFQEESGGNPRFLEEMIRELVERSLIRRERFRWTLDPANLETLPVASGIKDISLRRIRQLPRDLRNILDRLAVFPDPVTLDTFQRFTGTPLEDLLAGLRTLTMRGFLAENRRRDQWSYRFRQNQVRTVIYEKIPAHRRKQWHLLAAQTLESTAPTPDYAALAYHYHHGGHRMNAMRFYFRAGRQAVTLFAYEDAVTYITRMLDLLTTLGHPKRDGRPVWTNAAFNLLAESYMESGRPADAEKILRKHLAFTNRHGVTLDRVFILQNLGALNFNTGRLDKAARYYRKAQNLLETLPASNQTEKIKIQLDYNTGIIALSRGDLDLAENALRNTIRIAHKTKDKYLKAAGYANLAVCLSLKNIPADDIRRRSLKDATRHRFIDIQIINRMEQAMALTHLGNISKACRIIDDTIKTADDLGAARWKILTRLWSIRTLLLAGRFNDARTFTQDAENLASAAHPHHHQLRILHAKGLTLVYEGRREEGIHFLEQSVTRANQMKNRVFGLLAGADLMEARAEGSGPESDRNRLKSMHRLCRKLHIMRLYDDFTYINALLAWTTGDVRTARRILRKWLLDTPAGETLQRLKGRALQAVVTFSPNTPLNRLAQTWKPLVRRCRKNGIRYLEFQFLCLWIQQQLAVTTTLNPRYLETCRNLLERVRELAEAMASPHFRLLADTLALQLGRRTGDPDTSYRAHRRLAEIAADSLETQTIQSDIRTLTTARSTEFTGTPPAEKFPPADDVATILSQDPGGRLLLEAIRMLENADDE